MKMMLMRWFFFFLVIPAIEGSLRLWKLKGSSIEERVTRKILETCYGDHDFKELIFILGDFNEILDEASVIRMENLLNVDGESESHQYSSIGVNKVIIIEDSPKKLHSDLISFNKTRWWNHMMPFFIIGKNDGKCENFKKMLSTTWKMDIINSIYICSQSDNTTLYTLNPITNYAPNPWKSMKGLNDSNIYHQVFDPHTSCSNLNYDKTNVLNGYEIKAIVPSIPDELSAESAIDRLSEDLVFRSLDFILSQMNARALIEDVLPHDLVYLLEELNADVLFAGLSELWLEGEESTRLLSLFPVVEINQHVVLIKSNEQTVLYKIRHLWSTQVLCVAAIALIILFLILMMKNGEVTAAILDIMKFLTYVSIGTEMRSHSVRIYFTTMLIFIVISNGVFQGKIAAFLTKPDKVPPIETMEELEDLRYHFYILHWSSRQLLPSWYPFELIGQVNTADVCINYVLNGTLNACIMPLFLYEEKQMSKPLDLVRPRNIVNSNNWNSRRNWPLYDRFNDILMRLIESGVYTSWINMEVSKIKDKLRANSHELALAEIVPPYRPIELVKLDFAFNLLAIGLSFATFVLIIELRMREI